MGLVADKGYKGSPGPQSLISWHRDNAKEENKKQDGDLMEVGF